MSVYVDAVRHGYGRMVMCHMWADTPEELHAMADAIGIQRRWFQTPPKASWDHYDISLGKKAQAIARGPVLTDMFGPVEFEANQDILSDDPQRAERGQRRLEQIAFSRSLRKQA